MRRILACRDEAIMAGAASADYLGVVHSESWNPDVGIMAVFANIRCQNVRRVLASRFDAVVAAYAIAGDADVIEIRRQPTDCRMAVIAIIAARDMRWMLACGRRAVMARTAGTEDLGVVDSVGGRKNICIVTIFTNVGCLYMRRTLADGINAVVAAGAIVDNTQVVEGRWSPGDRCMAVIAGIAAGYMCRMFACRNNTIMTAVAGADDLRVVNGEDGCKDVGVVAVLANITGLDVCQVLTNGIDTVMAVNTLASDVQMVKVGWQPA